MFPSPNPGNRFAPRKASQFTPSNNQSPGMYSQPQFSPRNTSRDSFSPSNISQNFYSPRNTSQAYSPRNSSLNMYSPGNRPNFSPNPLSKGANSPFNTPKGMYPRNSSPIHQSDFRNRSCNSSRNSSEYFSCHQSFDSSGNSSRLSNTSRGSPYRNNRMRGRKMGNNSEERYNIRDYINPSMLENPWAELEKESC